MKALRPSLMQRVKLKATGKFSSAIKKLLRKKLHQERKQTQIPKKRTKKTKTQQLLRNTICFFENPLACLYI